MGIRLIVEVLTSAPEALTHREKLLLVVLAEDANDDTRITWNSVERPQVLRGAKLSRAQLYAVLKSLITKGALEKLTAGQKNGTAKYKLAKFPESQCPEIPDAEPPSQGPGNADTDDSQRPSSPDTEPNGQCQENADTDPSQCQGFWDVSVRESGTPTPLNPSTTTPLASQQEGQPAGSDLDYGIPPAARPLVDGLSAAGVIVRWPFKGNGWFPLLSLISKSGATALLDHAVTAAARATEPIDSARYFMRGWGELPPLPPPDAKRPKLKSVKPNGHRPYQPPTDHSVYENGFHTHARTQASGE
ncbi:hypothetical protein F7R91_14450 [Streptomyces luteolifulvus]|uniref:Uncharacterized protein n=1 Tax=Streptomyces luteolifulvus TaxID=2615112 RepID=A0A6H9V3K6_9ACTN|nr:hypothetical protein [Streptomyces luteolifulvus]KAB1146777.1 hypothetical protein F7R91_14450 [Streptomyces luteolifulvus]